MTIWKFTLSSSAPTIEMPADARILSVQSQFGDVCLWAMVDPDATKAVRQFRIFGTGQPISEPERPKRLSFIGTVQVSGGQFVWHVFEVVR